VKCRRSDPYETDLHTYAITAGHCRTTPAGYARTTRSGLTGGFTRAIVDPPLSGGADYGLIDFGIRSLPLSFIGDTPTADDHPHSPPEVWEGVRSAV
jgi:hypothetical protein